MKSIGEIWLFILKQEMGNQLLYVFMSMTQNLLPKLMNWKKNLWRGLHQRMLELLPKYAKKKSESISAKSILSSYHILAQAQHEFVIMNNRKDPLAEYHKPISRTEEHRMWLSTTFYSFEETTINLIHVWKNWDHLFLINLEILKILKLKVKNEFTYSL